MKPYRNETILEQLRQRALKNSHSVAIGIGDDLDQNLHIYSVAQNISEQFQVKILFIGHPEPIERLQQQINIVSGISLISDEDPYSLLFNKYLRTESLLDEAGNEFQIDAIIRGGLSSAPFLKELRSFQFDFDPGNKENSAITNRLALLETAAGHQFFFAPVGIDEANNLETKRQLVEDAIQFFAALEITPKIAILSGGRLGDIGRDAWIDQTIQEAEELTTQTLAKYPEVAIKHYQIMIEDAIQDEVNMILAPEGIAGNLIYRTLIHLGLGKSYGALYLSHFNQYHKIIIDTSRVAPEFEIEGAFYFAMGIN